VQGKETRSPIPVHITAIVQGKETQSPVHVTIYITAVLQGQGIYKNNMIVKMKQPLPLHISMFKIDRIFMR
jgi:hypothetical protein